MAYFSKYYILAVMDSVFRATAGHDDFKVNSPKNFGQ
jgi:hypothetical protein